MAKSKASEQYNVACTALTELIHRRNNELMELNSLIIAVSGLGNYGGIVTTFNVARAKVLVGDLSDTEDAIARMIVEVNRYAEKCGKPRLRTFS